MPESSKRKRTVAASSQTKRKTAAKKTNAKKKSARAADKAQSIPSEIEAVISKTVIEESKYFGSPAMQKISGERQFELPQGYGDNKIVLMVRDPYWLHAYWEMPAWKMDELRSLMGHESFAKAKKMLRVYDVTDIIFTGMNANKSYDIDLSSDARNWYLNPGEPNRSYCVDIGYMDPYGKFYVVARSNIVTSPRDSMSDVIDEEWMTIDWERMYALSGGFGIGRSSGEIKELINKRLKEELSSGFVSSWARDLGRPEKEKNFWLVVNTELIVYGATEPDAKVTVQGFPVKLRHDGTFSLRFALPDGKQEIPVEAVNKAGDEKRKITPSVEKRTK